MIRVHYFLLFTGVGDREREKMNGFLFTDTAWKTKIMEWRFDTGEDSTARYGMIALGKSPDGRYVDSMYVMYKLDFKIAPKRIVTENRAKLLDLFVLTHISVQLVECSLGAKQANRLQNMFRAKAMEGFYNEGIIKSINYIDSEEAITNN